MKNAVALEIMRYSLEFSPKLVNTQLGMCSKILITLRKASLSKHQGMLNRCEQFMGKLFSTVHQKRKT